MVLLSEEKQVSLISQTTTVFRFAVDLFLVSVTFEMLGYTHEAGASLILTTCTRMIVKSIDTKQVLRLFFLLFLAFLFRSEHKWHKFETTRRFT